MVSAVRYASDHQIQTIGLVGATGGQRAELAGTVIRVPSVNVQHIQETHITIGHILCELVERTVFPRENQRKRVMRCRIGQTSGSW